MKRDSFLDQVLPHIQRAGKQNDAAFDQINHYAGVGVAMQNAEGPVKDCADYVTAADNDHDGVAEAVEKFILK